MLNITIGFTLMNNYPDDFNISSDYATISAIDRGVLQFPLPQNLTLGPGGVHIDKKEIYVDKNGILRLLISASTHPERTMISSNISFTRNFKVSGGGTSPIGISISGWRESENKIVCALSVMNPYIDTITNLNPTETFTVEARIMTFPY